MTQLQTRNALAAIQHYIEQVEAGEPLALSGLCRAVADNPAAVEFDIDTLDSMGALAERARKAAKMLTERARILEAGAEHVETELLAVLGETGLEALEGLTRRATSKANGGLTAMSLDTASTDVGFVVSVGSDEYLPENMRPYLNKLDVWTLDKIKLREDLGKGKTLEWARLSPRGKHLVIKAL